MEIINPNKNHSLVTVCLLTYNHKNYIEKTLESVLAQKTNFDFNIVIADDCSTDGTMDIVKRYANEYPNKITAIIQNPNIGAYKNVMQLLQYPNSKYIAFTECDDYWISDKKLQVQTDYLEKHPHVSLSSHNSFIKKDTLEYLFNKDKKYLEGPYEKEYAIEDYIERDFFHSSAIFFRKSALKEFPEWYKDLFGGDYFLVLLISMNGPIHYVNDVFSVYRIHNKSISHYSSRYEIFKNFDLHFKKFDTYSGFKYTNALRKKAFSFRYNFFYYHPNYLKKCWFAIRHLGQILRISPSVISGADRFKIFVPTMFLKSKTNLFTKNQ